MLTVTLVLSLAAIVCVSGEVSDLSQSQATGEWQTIWSDEFDGSAVDATKWRFETVDTVGGGWGNAELQTYTTEAASVSNGWLTITSRREADGTYTSARMSTQDRFGFTYGRVRARMRLPYERGVWPAFWMLGEAITTVG